MEALRIRTVKPEFWRSDDVAALSIADRLLFIGLWSYVDDSGIGVDKLPHICADLFAPDLASDPAGVFERVTGGLQTLAERGMIQRYTVEGKPYLYVTNWTSHQRIDKPSKRRYPLPDQAEHVDSSSPREDYGSAPANYAPGTGEQGNRGTDTNAQPSVAREPSRFPDWWVIWGKKKAKGDAEKAYKASVPKKISHDDLMAKTRAYWDHVKASGTDLQYVPYPATWLRAEQWDDDLTDTPGQQGAVFDPTKWRL